MKLSDTLTGEKRDFTPSGNEVRIYVCGVTPYSSAHVGHAMSYIVFDVLHRYLEFRGFKVKRVQNFTDIDDKLIDRAAREGTTVEALAEKHIAEYFDNMAALNVRAADVYPRATQEVPKIIELIAGLIDSGHAYESNGDVYFRVRSDEQYGKLSHRSLDAMRAGARVEPGVQKEHPMDFALWKSAKPASPRGRVHGATDAPAGISSAQRWRCAIWARASISTAAGRTSSFRITRMRSRRAKRSRACVRSLASGCTTAC